MACTCAGVRVLRLFMEPTDVIEALICVAVLFAFVVEASVP